VDTETEYTDVGEYIEVYSGNQSRE